MSRCFDNLRGCSIRLAGVDKQPIEDAGGGWQGNNKPDDIAANSVSI